VPVSIHIDVDVPMEMRDGTILRANIYRPDDNQKHPTIFMRAFWKTYGSFWHIDIFRAIYHGYALVGQVIRGRGTSTGDWTPEASQGKDGYDSVEWIANQSWCNGVVGQFGFSHAGGMAAQTAMENPPHLKAIAPCSSGVRAGGGQGSPGGYNTGGAISYITALQWLSNESRDVVNRMERQGKDVTEIRRSLEWAASNPDEYINFLPFKDMPFAKFERIGAMWAGRFSGTPQRSAEEVKTYERVMVPCAHLTGWYDGPCIGTFESFINMRKKGGSQLARENQYMLCGPWAHTEHMENYLGDWNFGNAAIEPPSSYLLNFFDKHLQDKDIHIAPVRYFLMGRNQWMESNDWPLPETQWQRFYLHSNGKANTSSGDGLLSRDEPQSEPPDKFVYDPLNPVPTLGGNITASPAGFGFARGPMDQSSLERRGDVLCYRTPPLTENVEITGPLEIHIFASTSARDTDFTAKFVDVYPDGRSQNLVDGIKRAKGLKSLASPEFITPGQVYEYVITMGPTSQMFFKGHRMRIDISSSNFPMYDRNMNTGNPIGEDATGVKADQTVYHEAKYASYIDLPVIPNRFGG
jgi:putative CocE/NonD family hydrolase